MATETEQRCQIKVMTPRGLLGGVIEGPESTMMSDGDEITINGFYAFDSKTLKYGSELQLFRFDKDAMSLIPVEAA